MLQFHVKESVVRFARMNRLESLVGRSPRYWLAGLILGGLFLSALWVGGQAQAYNDLDEIPCKLPYSGGSSYLIVYSQNHPTSPPTGAYTTAFADARFAWSSSSTPSWFILSSSGPTIGQKDLGSGTLGEANGYCIGGTLVATDIWLDDVALSGLGASVKQKVAAQEYGHAMGLGHSYYLSVMKQGLTGISYTPSSDDECAVNTEYTSTRWPAGWWCSLHSH
jgi:hypothetical protein